MPGPTTKRIIKRFDTPAGKMSHWLERLDDGTTSEVYQIIGTKKGKNPLTPPSRPEIIKLFKDYNPKKVLTELARTQTYAPHLEARAAYIDGRPVGLIMKKAGDLNLVDFFNQFCNGEIDASAHHFIQICKNTLIAVNAIHEKGGIHRDLKEENVMVDKATRAVTIIDYAWAVPTTKIHKKPLCRKGTLHFFPPELYANGHDNSPIHQKGDIYSIGIVLATLLGECSIIEIDETKPKVALPLLFQRSQSEQFEGLFHHLPELSDPIKADLERLIFNMTRFNPDLRISLPEAIAELERIEQNLLAEQQSTWCTIL